MRARTWIGAALGLAIGIGAGKVAASHAWGSKPVESAAASVPATKRNAIVVPRASTPIVIDGEVDEKAWTAGPIARLGPYGEHAYSDARLAWGDGMLYVVLYAADEDIHAANAKHDEPLWSEDSMRISFFDKNGVESAIEISPRGTIMDLKRANGGAPDLTWESGAKVAIDVDGTIDDARDNDEEWVVEMSIPLASLGLEGKPEERVGLALKRCDAGKTSSKRTCASLGGPDTMIELGR